MVSVSVSVSVSVLVLVSVSVLVPVSVSVLVPVSVSVLVPVSVSVLSDDAMQCWIRILRCVYFLIDTSRDTYITRRSTLNIHTCITFLLT
jgi:hypothetical protein